MKTRTFAIIAAMLLAVSAMAQAFGDSTSLNTQQWNHALAIVAQLNALNDGYGQATADFESRNPEGYSLDDLNNVYKGKRNWDDNYAQYKKRENEKGTVADVKKLAGGLATNVEAELKRYMESSAEPQPQAQPEPAPVDTLATVDMPDLAQDEQQPSGNSQAWHLIIDLVLAIIALAALYLAWKAQASARRLRDNYIEDIEAVNKNMEQLAEEMSQHINTLSSKIATQRRNTMHDFTTEHRESKPTREHKPEPKSEPKPARRGPAKTLYLSKPDDNECFMRATETFELGNSIYVLTTHDGVHGEFSVIENSDVHRFALMMPSENLTRACSGNAIQMSAGKTRIVTDREGEAHFENGQWHVIVKAIIHYE